MAGNFRASVLSVRFLLPLSLVAFPAHLNLTDSGLTLKLDYYKAVLKRHDTESYACAKEAGKVVSGSFPEGVQSSMQYGAGVKALAATLNAEGMMSVARVHDFLSAALGRLSARVRFPRWLKNWRSGSAGQSALSFGRS